MSESKGLKNETLIAGLIVAAWLCVTLVVLGIFKITQGWPAWLILLFFIEAGANLKNLINISVGGIAGLLLAGVLPLAVGAIAPVLGLQVSILIVVFIIVFLLIGLGDVAHMFFNNYAFRLCLFHNRSDLPQTADFRMVGSIDPGRFILCGRLPRVFQIVNPRLCPA